MKTVLKKAVVMAAMLVAAATSHAQVGVSVDGGSYVAAIEQVRALQAELPANLGALPSTYAAADKVASPAPGDTNQQILAELVMINTTLQQLVELEQHKFAAAAAAH
ncbi:hypothetical protein BamIOP4010DRAFT_0616 [Burkholderia ambifaria IOP40-10]|uniref:Uncharacterized protein n=1 Tax=Burkholderia ambifaria IOP40-10 TaxID=396596 RepID=B1F9A7_9BURK|nr:hypothetical protein [Burkholderia ambifaria]EDT05879.1 hypothetical protein BamIOP4010DRAFT_0616 [Burkholderia ambifaria IOP40-10]